MQDASEQGWGEVIRGLVGTAADALREHRLLIAALILLGAVLLALALDQLVTRLVQRWTTRTATGLDDRLVSLLHGPIVKSVVLAGLIVSASFLDMDPEAYTTTRHWLLTLTLLVWALFAFRASAILLRAASRQPERFRTIEERTYPLFDNLGKLLITALALFLLIGIWEWDATGWIASAGVVGIAVGFAAQDTLSNLFAGVSIIADAPYRVGDFINLDSGERGRVVHIGLRSTRLLTRDDIEVTIPNAVMSSARILNETRGPSTKRRVKVRVGVAYGSDIDQVRRVLLEAGREQSGVCEDPPPRVRFRSFGDSGLDFELLCWIPEPVLRGQVLDALNSAVYRRFAAEGIEIPYPKRDVYIKEMPSSGPGPGA